MATGIDLGGLAGVTGLDFGDVSIVHASQSSGGAFNVTGVVAPLSIVPGGQPPATPITLAVGTFSNDVQTLNAFHLDYNGGEINLLSAQGGTLVGWNEDGLLFAKAAIGGGSNFLFIADPTAAGSIDSTGLPGDTTFGTDPNDIPLFLTSVSTTAPCFAAGTHISTPDGDTAVERLKEGDTVLTMSGAAKAIKWVGNRRVNCHRHPRPTEVTPVRIKAQAFGENLPQRDLLVSPGHSIYVDGVLIPAGFLVNGATVVQDDVEHIHYYHIELDAHDVVLAEGLAAESYLDDENRHAFNNGATYALRPEGSAFGAHPDLDPKSWENACAPRVMAGPQLTEVKQRLIEQADALGYHLIDDADVHLVADGQKIQPCHTVGTRYWFMLSGGAREVSLNSNSGVPMQLIADHGDGRCLGVAVSEFKCDGAALALEQVFAGNPYAIETHGAMPWIWTNGSARLAIALPADEMTMIEVATVMSMKSWSRKPNLTVVDSLDVAHFG